MKPKRKPLTPIQKSAKGEECTVNLDGCIPGGETTVLAHDTRHIPGSQRKSDFRACYACASCHDILDGRTIVQDFNHYRLGYEWGRAIAITHIRLQAKGLIWLGGEIVNKTLPRRR